MNLLDENGKLKLLTAAEWDAMDRLQVRVWCRDHARYGLPTRELIDFLRPIVSPHPTIEIGAGSGDFGYRLDVKMTDSHIQANQPGWANLHYALSNQPMIKYGQDVEKLDALSAVQKYKPEIVLASWVTQWVDPELPPKPQGSVFGIKENEMLKHVKLYIMLGNMLIHGEKDILKTHRHDIMDLPFLRSRASRPDLDRLFIFYGDKK